MGFAEVFLAANTDFESFVLKRKREALRFSPKKFRCNGQEIKKVTSFYLQTILLIVLLFFGLLPFLWPFPHSTSLPPLLIPFRKFCSIERPAAILQIVRLVGSNLFTGSLPFKPLYVIGR